MLLRKRIWAVVLVGIAMTGGARGQTIVVTAKSLKDLAGDLEFLVKGIAPEGDPGAGHALGMLRSVGSGQMIKGLDVSRGVGMAVELPPDFPNGGAPMVAVAVPVSDYKGMIEAIKGMGIGIEDLPEGEGFTHRVGPIGGNMSLYLIESKGYALATPVPDSSAMLKGLDPTDWAKKAKPGSSLSATVKIDEIPQPLKDVFLGQLNASLDAKEAREPGEDDVHYQTRIATQKAGQNTIGAIVKDGQTLSMAIGVDRKASELAIDVAFSGKPGTALAKALNAIAGKRSRFAFLGEGAPFAAWISLPMAKFVRDTLATAIEHARKVDLADLTAGQKQIVARGLDLLKSNLQADSIDLMTGLVRSKTANAAEPHYSMLAALTVRDGKAFDKLFRDSIAEATPKEGTEFKLDVAKAGGTVIHEIRGLKVEENTAAYQAFGSKATLAFAFRDDAILGAVGEDSAETLRRAAEEIAHPPAPDATTAGAVAIVARVSRFDAVARTDRERTAYKAAAAESFHGEGPRKDRVSLRLTGEGDAVQLRISVDIPALRFAVVSGQELKK